MYHIKIQNGRPLTDKELDDIIKIPQPEPTVIIRGLTSIYECYIVWQLFRSMAPKRMKIILEGMLRSNVKYTAGQVLRIREALSEVNEKLHAPLSK